MYIEPEENYYREFLKEKMEIEYEKEQELKKLITTTKYTFFESLKKKNNANNSKPTSVIF